jgi:predicted RNA-binding Zn ribbon-like protein
MAERSHREPAEAPWRPGPIPHIVFDQVCLDFANSEITNHLRTGPKYDRLGTAEWRRWFVKRWGFSAPAQLPDASLTRLVALRSLIRSLLAEHGIPSPGQVRRLNRVLAGSPYIWRLEMGGSVGPKSRPALELRPVDAGWHTVMADVVASYAELAASGNLERVKPCGNSNCALLFYDASVNRTRRWCDASLCGNLVKVREYRARHRQIRRRRSS